MGVRRTYGGSCWYVKCHPCRPKLRWKLSDTDSRGLRGRVWDQPFIALVRTLTEEWFSFRRRRVKAPFFAQAEADVPSNCLVVSHLSRDTLYNAAAVASWHRGIVAKIMAEFL